MQLDVLIVDDEKRPRELLAKHIEWEALGIQNVWEAEDGLRALEVIQEHRPGIIISDIKMPRMNGMEFAEQVRRMQPDIRFIFLSGYPDKEYLMEAIKLQVARFVEKPIRLARMTEILREVIAEYRSACQKCDPRIAFFRGGELSGPDLCGTVYTPDKSALREFSVALRKKERHDSELIFHRIAEEMRGCEGTDPDYIRHVFVQLALLLGETAETHGADAVQKECEDYLYWTAKADTFDALEERLQGLMAQFFCFAESRESAPAERITSYLETHFGDPSLTVNSLASALNFSPNYLCRAYKEAAGGTINQKLNTLRIERAKYLLANTPKKLYEVGREVGYADGKYFTRVFAKLVGISPKQYRENQRNEK